MLTVKINEQLDERENKYLYLQFEKYLLKTDGRVVLTGIEAISNDVRDYEG